MDRRRGDHLRTMVKLGRMKRLCVSRLCRRYIEQISLGDRVADFGCVDATYTVVNGIRVLLSGLPIQTDLLGYLIELSSSLTLICSGLTRLYGFREIT